MYGFGRNRDILAMTAPSGGVVKDAVYLIGSLLVVATVPAPEGDRFVAFIGPGIISHAKPGSQAWTLGVPLYWDDSAKVFTTTAGANTLAGVAAEAVGDGVGETLGRVRLMPTLTSGGGPGGDSLLHQATVTLDNDEIKALPTTEPEIVAAPGANLALVHVRTTLRLTKTVVYTNIDTDAYLNLANGGSEASSYILNDTADGIAELTSFFGGAAITAFQLLRPNAYASAAWGTFTALGETVKANAAMNLVVDNGGQDFMGGHVDNTLTISVLYAVLNTLTGEYV